MGDETKFGQTDVTKLLHSLPEIKREHPFIAEKLEVIIKSAEKQCRQNSKLGLFPGFGLECIDKLFDLVVKHQKHSENIVEIMNQYGSLCDQCFLPERLRQYMRGGDSKMLPKAKTLQRLK